MHLHELTWCFFTSNYNYVPRNLIFCPTLAIGVVGQLSLKKRQLTLGYLECLGQPSMATMILWPASVAAWRVSMRMRGIRRSAGVKRWRVDCKKKGRKEMVNAEGRTRK